MRKALARSNWRSNLHRPTCTEHMRKALARSNWRRALAQSNLLRALAQSNLHTCVQQLAESNLRAAAWHNAACADHFREKSRGAVREETRMMRWSSHVTIHIEHRRVQTRSPQQCKKVSRGWMSAWGKLLSGQSSSSFLRRTTRAPSSIVASIILGRGGPTAFFHKQRTNTSEVFTVSVTRRHGPLAWLRHTTLTRPLAWFLAARSLSLPPAIAKPARWEGVPLTGYKMLCPLSCFSPMAVVL